MSRSPFHRGELEAQARAGGGSPGAGIRELMTEQHRVFFESLRFVAVASRLEDWPVATLLTGEPGFVSVSDLRTLRVLTYLDPSDPATRGLVKGAPAGLLGIDLRTRRRNRANGVIASASTMEFVLSVRQSFGNCPQYIRPRELRRVHTTAQPIEHFDRLNDEAREAISRADTFFVATGSRANEAAGGMDISHRGGRPGFVRIEGDTLTIPDYRGNRYFNTFGNLLYEPRAALLFVDFARGDLLHVQGTTEIVWDGPEVRAFSDAERLWRVHLQRYWLRRGAVPLRWTLPNFASASSDLAIC